MEKQPEALVEKVYSAGGLQQMMVVEEASTQAKEMKSKGHETAIEIHLLNVWW